MKTILILICFSATLMADGVLNGPASRIRRGAGEPSAGTCASVSDVGKVWVRTDQNDTSTPLRNCSQTGPGTFAWVSGGGGSGSGASAISDLTDCKVTYSSGTVISIGACGSQVDNYTTTAIAGCSTSAAPASSGTLRVYIAQDGTYTLGYSGANTATCTGWTTATSISAFPTGSQPIATITWTTAAWNNDAVDLRRFFRPTPIAAGADMDSSVVNGVNTLNPASATIPRKANIQSGALLRCASASGSSPYTCAMSPTLTGYTDGMIVEFEATGTALSGTVNLNIDSIGNAAIKQCDGSTNPASGDIAVGRQVRLTYDGTVFRLPCNPATVTSGGATITSTTYAALPGTCTEGNLYLLTDSMIEMARCGASNTYTYYRNGKQITPPSALASFTAITTGATGTCNPANSGGGISLRCAASGVTNKYLAALPSGDTWTVTAGFTQFCTAAFCGFSFGVSNTSTAGAGTQKVMSVTSNNSQGYSLWSFVGNWANFAPFTTDLDSITTLASSDMWFRIKQTSGGNRTYEHSSDGINWEVFLSQSADAAYDWYFFGFSGRGTANLFHLKVE